MSNLWHLMPRSPAFTRHPNSKDLGQPLHRVSAIHTYTRHESGRGTYIRIIPSVQSTFCELLFLLLPSNILTLDCILPLSLIFPHDQPITRLELSLGSTSFGIGNREFGSSEMILEILL